MFRRLFQKRLRKQEIDEEFEAHLALESKLLQERGLSREQADFRAHRSFGNKSLLAEDTREAWVWGWFDRLSQDLRYAARTLLRNRAFTPAAVLSIALGIGAGTAVYSIADTIFLRPLPYKDPGRLMWVAIHFQKMRMEFLGSPEYVTWRRDNDVFQSLAATQASPGETMLLNGENAVEVHNARVSANFLETLGIRPAIGRDFDKSEELPNGPKAILLTDGLWQRRYHRNIHVVGESIRMDGQQYTVIGVLPRSFQFPMDVKLDVLTTLPVSPTASWHDRSVSTWAVYGRLKPGVSMTQARANLQAVVRAEQVKHATKFSRWNSTRVRTAAATSGRERTRAALGSDRRRYMPSAYRVCQCIESVAGAVVCPFRRVCHPCGYWRWTGASGTATAYRGSTANANGLHVRHAACIWNPPRVRSLCEQRIAPHERGDRRWARVHNRGHRVSLRDTPLCRLTLAAGWTARISRGRFSDPNARGLCLAIASLSEY